MDQQVNVKWKYATFALVALIGVQFVWWDRQAPQVLRPQLRAPR
jgi:hypothetical protein